MEAGACLKTFLLLHSERNDPEKRRARYDRQATIIVLIQQRGLREASSSAHEVRGIQMVLPFLVLRKSYSQTEGDCTDWNHSIMEDDAIMENLALKIRLAVLWLFVAVAMSANTILYFVVPGVIDEIRTGEVVGMQATHELLLVMAITYFWVPLVMAVLSLSLRDRGNRLANIVLGIFYSVFILFELVMNVTTVAYPYLILMDISAIVVSALIAWYAWKSKQKA